MSNKGILPKYSKDALLRKVIIIIKMNSPIWIIQRSEWMPQ